MGVISLEPNLWSSSYILNLFMADKSHRIESSASLTDLGICLLEAYLEQPPPKNLVGVEMTLLVPLPGQPYKAKVWWQALLVACYMTGWRIGELLAMRVEDVDFEAGTIITRNTRQ